MRLALLVGGRVGVAVVLGVRDKRLAVHGERRENRRGVVPGQVTTGVLDDEVGIVGDRVLLEELVERELVLGEETIGDGLYGRPSVMVRASCEEQAYLVNLSERFGPAQAQLKDMHRSACSERELFRCGVVDAIVWRRGDVGLGVN